MSLEHSGREELFDTLTDERACVDCWQTRFVFVRDPELATRQKFYNFRRVARSDGGDSCRYEGLRDVRRPPPVAAVARPPVWRPPVGVFLPVCRPVAAGFLAVLPLKFRPRPE